MLPRTRLLNLALTLLTIAVVVGAFQSFQRNRDAFERLDFDYQWQRETVRIVQIDEESSAERAGLRPGDEIWLVNGVPPGDVDGLRRTLRREGTATLLVSRGDETLTIAYEPPGLEVDYQYLFLTFIGFLYLVIGIFTYTRGQGSETTLFFLVTLAAFIVFVYSPAGKTNLTFELIWMVEELARIFLPPLMLHFFLRFPRRMFESKLFYPLIYGPPTILALWVIDLLMLGNVVPIMTPERSFRLIDRWEMLHFAIYISLAVVAITWTYKTAAAAGQKKQIKWIYLGMIGGFVPFLLLYLIPYISTGSDSPYTTVAILPLAFIPLAFAVSILRYKLWDVEVIIKEALAYTVTFAFGVIAFSGVNLILSRMIEESMAAERNFLAFASGLLIAGVLVPMKNRVESLIERFLYRETWRHRREMSYLAQELATFHDLDELIEIIRERLAAAMGVRRINVYVRDGADLILYDENPALPDRVDPTELDSVPAGRVVHLDRPRLPESSELPMQLLAGGYRYMFAIRHREELQGLLICGTKGADERLSSDDLRLINSLVAPLALAIENARLYGRLRTQLDQIRSLKEYNENIIESSSSAIVVCAADGLVLTANQAFWDLVGVRPGPADYLQELIPIEEVDDSMMATDVHFENRRGEQKEVSITRSAFDAPDAPEGTSVVVISDISEIAALERELQEKDRFASLGLLAAGIAHEVNTPLTGISSYAQLLLSETDENDPRFQLLKKMEMQTFRASRLVNNLLDFAADRRKEREPVNLKEAVEGAIELNEDSVLCDTTAIEQAIDDDLVVSANVYELQQVVTNLLQNACDAMERRGTIRITGARDESDALLTVSDTGPGVPEHLQDQIFKPLVTTKQGRGGTGLGLSISKRIIEAFGGDIRLVSAAGEGATFEIRIPLWVADASSD